MSIWLKSGRQFYGFALIIAVFCVFVMFATNRNYLSAQDGGEETTTEPATTGEVESALPDDSTGESDLPPELEVDVAAKKKSAGSEGDIRAGSVPDSLWDRFRQSGWCGFVIFLIEIAVLTLVIESFISVNVNKVIPTELTLDLENKIDANQIDEAIETCYENPGVMTNILRAGLEAPTENVDEAKDCVDMAGDQETEGFVHRINYLSVFAAIAPMFGLLGTVIGMVTSFALVATESALGKPEKLAAGINMALLTTQYGLMVGIPAMFMYYFFKMRANKILLAIEAGVKNLIRWRWEKRKGLPPLGLFPNRMLLAIDEALNDGFLSLVPILGFFLGPLSITKGLKIKDEISNAMTAQTKPGTEPAENPGNPETAKEEGEKPGRKIVITPEVSASLWKASAAVICGIVGFIISVAALALFILAVFFNKNILGDLWYSGLNNPMQ